MRDEVKLQLNITLLNNNVTWDKIEESIKNFDKNNIVKQEDNFLLYKRNSQSKNPTWLDIFNEKIWDYEEIDGSQTSSDGLTLFIKIYDDNKQINIFAINFGTGRFNLNKDKINKDFGICIAHKLFKQQKGCLVTSEIRSNEQNPINKKKSYGKEIDYNLYSLDLSDNDSIRSLNIKTNLQDFSKIIGKYESLKIHCIFYKEEIPCLKFLDKKLKGLLDIYKSVTKEDKKQLYKGLVPITNNDEIIFMNQKLENFLQSLDKNDNKDESFILFPSDDNFDMELASSFSYSVNNINIDNEYETLWLNDYLKLQENISIDNLKKDRVFIKDTEGKKIKEWNIYEILYGELEKDSKTICILSNGIWLETDKEKYDRVKKNVNSIVDNSFKISQNVKKETTKQIMEEIKKGNTQIFKERIFNRILCSDLSGEFFDELNKQVTFEGDKIEICDIYLPSANEFIHTKIKHNSVNLGHLFNQGYVSGKSLCIFKEQFLEKVNKLIVDSKNKLTTIDCKDYTIRFLILNPKTTNKLSYLTVMVLDSKINELKGYGFNVKLTWVNGIKLNPAKEIDNETKK